MNRYEVGRKTGETDIVMSVVAESIEKSSIDTPVGFLNHMLDAFSRHGAFSLNIKASGDLEVDQHHLVEDCGIVLGELFSKLTGDRRGIMRAGFFIMPMDDAFATVAVDLGGRPYLNYSIDLKRRFCGDLDTDLLREFFYAFSVSAKANLVIKAEDGINDHHKIEAVFKAFGRAVRAACQKDPRGTAVVPSTKGVL